MREQMVMLGFSDTFDCEAYRDDEKYMDYQEEAFKHMALRLNSQFQGVALRNMYGGMNKMLYMNFLDRMMALNPYMKAELMAMSAASNIHMGGNTGKYTREIFGGFKNTKDPGNIINEVREREAEKLKKVTEKKAK